MFLMFGSANRDEEHFAAADRFDITRNTSRAIVFGAGPHFCAGATAARSMVSDVALPMAFERLEGLRLDTVRRGRDRRLGVPRPAHPPGRVGRLTDNSRGAPDLLAHLDDPRQLALLVVLGDWVAPHSRCEAALR